MTNQRREIINPSAGDSVLRVRLASGYDKMKTPSAKERSLLWEWLKNVTAKHNIYQLAKNKVLLETHNDIVELAGVLESDKKAMEVDITQKEIRSASILVLCRTIKAIKIQGIDKSRICRLLRVYLHSEEPCMCTENSSPYIAKEFTNLNLDKVHPDL